MAQQPRRRMRREDLSDYIDADQVKITYVHEQAITFLVNGWKSFKKFITCDEDSNLPKTIKISNSYSKCQGYRPVPTLPQSPHLREELRRVRKGFDPLMMTLSRCRKQEKEEASIRQEAIDLAIQRRNNQSDQDEIPAPRKKILKHFYVTIEKEEQLYSSWELGEKKIELALDYYKKLEESNLIMESQNEPQSFFTLKPVENEESKHQSATASDSANLDNSPNQKQPQEVVPTEQILSATLDTIIESNVITSESKKSDQKPQNQESNPFKCTPTKTITLNELIQKNKNEASPFTSFNQPVNQNETTALIFQPPLAQTANSLPFRSQQPQTPFHMFANNNFNHSQGLFNSNRVTTITPREVTHAEFFSHLKPVSHPHSLPNNAPPKIAEPQPNQFLKGISSTNVTNVAIKDYFKPKTNDVHRLFDSPQGSTKTQKKQPQNYRRKRVDNAIRIQ